MLSMTLMLLHINGIACCTTFFRSSNFFVFSNCLGMLFYRISVIARWGLTKNIIWWECDTVAAAREHRNSMWTDISDNFALWRSITRCQGISHKDQPINHDRFERLLMMKPSIHSESEFQYQAGWSMARAQWINRGHLSLVGYYNLTLDFSVPTK